MPNPGVQSQFIAKSGGNQFNGEVLPRLVQQLAAGLEPARRRFAARRFGEGGNEIDQLLRHRHQRRRPDQEGQDLVVRHLPQQYNAVAQPQFPFDKTFDTKLWNAGRQGHLPDQPEQQAHRLLPVGPEVAAEPPAVRRAYIYNDPGPTNMQDSGSWVYKAEWNGTLSDKLYVEARYGDFGYYFPLLANGDEDYFWRDTGRSADRPPAALAARSRPQADHWRGHLLPRHREGQPHLQGRWRDPARDRLGRLRAAVSAATSTIIRQRRIEPGRLRASRRRTEVGRLGRARRRPDVAVGAERVRRLPQRHLVGRPPDGQRRRPLRPLQGLSARAAAAGGTVGPGHGAGATFAQTDLTPGTQFAPRIGATFDLSGDGQTVIKANYGLFWHNPGVTRRQRRQPEHHRQVRHLHWNDVNGDRRWQSGEEGARTTQSLAGAITLDPDIKQPLHARGQRVASSTSSPRPSASAPATSTRPRRPDRHGLPGPRRAQRRLQRAVPFADLGPDNILAPPTTQPHALGMPTGRPANFPLDQVVDNLPAASRATRPSRCP